jgi:hypothetical protein
MGFGELPAEEHLEGNDPVEALLSGLVNHAHPAVADLGQEFVVGEVAQAERRFRIEANSASGSEKSRANWSRQRRGISPSGASGSSGVRNGGSADRRWEDRSSNQFIAKVTPQHPQQVVQSRSRRDRRRCGRLPRAELGEAPTQPQHRDPHRSRAHAESLGEFGVGLTVLVTQDVALEFREQVAVPGRRRLGLEPRRAASIKANAQRRSNNCSGVQRSTGSHGNVRRADNASRRWVENPARFGDADGRGRLLQVIPQGHPEKRPQPGLRRFEALEGLAGEERSKKPWVMSSASAWSLPNRRTQA